MEMISVPGVELATLALGPRDAPAVVMLHGLILGNMASWYSGFASPLARSHRVVLYDQRGHGTSSTAATGFDLDTQADDLHAVLAHHSLASDAVDLVGHSMGALIALRFALRQPQRVRRLVLVDAPMPASAYVAPSLRGANSAAALSDFVAQQLHGLSGRRRERQQRRLAALLLDSTLINDVQQMGAESDAALAALQRPVLLVYGRHSPCAAAALHLQQVLPQATLQWLDCGHYIPDEAASPLCAVLSDYLSNDLQHQQEFA